MNRKENTKIMLDEQRHAYDTAYSSVKKYATKTFTVFGAELTFLLFYMKGEELQALKELFVQSGSGWWVFAFVAGVAFLVAAVLFILTLATDRRWRFPPNEQKLLSNNQYLEMETELLEQELISEYNEDIAHCVKKVHKMKVLSDTGVYFLVGGVICLLIIKLFGV